MNYRHAYHAGNFADVLKHATLALVLDHLKRKEAPFRVIDTHAGRGLYSLTSTEAGKTGEWRAGIGRLLGPGAKPLPGPVAELLAPYRAALAAHNAPGALTLYPGSPLIAQRLLRPQDTLIANELHPEERLELATALGRDRRVKIMQLDGWIALKSLLPPKERRGVVLIDPPFEAEDELARLGDGLVEGLARFATGVFIAWYPIKDLKSVARFLQSLEALAERPVLGIELMVRSPTHADRLNGCGLVVANPPHTLADQLGAVLPELTRRMAQDAGARYRIERLGAARQMDLKSAPAAKRRVRTRT